MCSALVKSFILESSGALHERKLIGCEAGGGGQDVLLGCSEGLQQNFLSEYIGQRAT